MSAHSQVSNPYYDYAAVRDLSMFFGRQDELRILYTAIGKRQCFSIVGLTHIGKSSLLKFLGSKKIQQHYGYDLDDRIFILTDWREYLKKTRDDFFRTVCEQIIKQSSSVVALQLPQLSGEDCFKKLLEDIHARGYRPVLLMDAFDKVTKNPHFDPDFFSFLRSLAGIYDLISYVTASIKPLYDVCHSDAVASSPFFNIFQTRTLGPLAVDEAYALIEQPAREIGYPFTNEECEWIIQQAGRHPFFIQVTCRHLLDEKLRLHNPGAEVNLKQVQARVYEELRPHFDDAWKDLAEDYKKELKQEASLHISPRRALPELSESWLFRKRIREVSQLDTPEITIKDVKDALDNLDNPEFLEHSRLGELHYVSQRVGHNVPALFAGKKGAVVRDLLKTAFEQMRAGNTRSDTAAEWRLYNILWYHYFRYHLPNPQIAARLGLSIRQFYREQERAIQMLLKELITMESAAIRDLEA